MDQFHYLEQKLKEVESELAEKSMPYAHLIEKLDEIPGIDKVLAMGILAEATNQMDKFKDERSFAAWAGVGSGNNESAGKKKIKMPSMEPALEKDFCASGTYSKVKTWIVLQGQVQQAGVQIRFCKQSQNRDCQSHSSSCL